MLRAALLLALLLALVPAASAQTTGPAFTLDIVQPVQPLHPGEAGVLKVLVARLCPNAALVLPQQDLDLRFMAPEAVQIAGPLHLVFAEQICATQQVQAVEATYQVSVTPEAEAGRSMQARAVAQPGFIGNPALSSGEEATADFLVPVAAPDAAAAVADLQPEQESPAPTVALLSLGLVALAVLVRRRD